MLEIITFLIYITCEMAILSIYNTLLTTHSIFSLHSERTSASCGFLPGAMTQTFTLEGPGPLLVLPELGCGIFPFTLMTGHGSSTRCPTYFLHSEHIFSHLHW